MNVVMNASDLHPLILDLKQIPLASFQLINPQEYIEQYGYDTQKSISNERSEQFDLPVDNDMPMFIPTSVNTDFEGKVETKTEKATDDSVQSASNMLKKLKRGKNEKR